MTALASWSAGIMGTPVGMLVAVVCLTSALGGVVDERSDATAPDESEAQAASGGEEEVAGSAATSGTELNAAFQPGVMNIATRMTL